MRRLIENDEMRITEAEYRQLYNSALEMCKEHPYLRLGQCLYNILHDSHPELATIINGTFADPFHASKPNDGRIEDFYHAIIKRTVNK